LSEKPREALEKVRCRKCGYIYCIYPSIPASDDSCPKCGSTDYEHLDVACASSRLPYRFSLHKCMVCGREFLVERFLIGVDHTISLNVICRECVLKSPNWDVFKKSYPKEAAAIEKWAKGEGG